MKISPLVRDLVEALERPDDPCLAQPPLAKSNALSSVSSSVGGAGKLHMCYCSPAAACTSDLDVRARRSKFQRGFNPASEEEPSFTHTTIPITLGKH